MALIVEWSDEALHNWERLINYLENNWEEKVIQKFANDQNQSLKQ